MRRALPILAAFAACLAAASCGSKQFETTYEKQEKNIQTIVDGLTGADPSVTAEYYKGSVKVTVKEGSGEALREDGAVSFFYVGYYVTEGRINSSNVFATNYDTFASSIRWTVSDSTTFTVSTVRLSDDDLVEGLRNGLVGVKGGEECYILFSGKHGFGKRKVGNVPASAALAYHLWIKSVSND